MVRPSGGVEPEYLIPCLRHSINPALFPLQVIKWYLYPFLPSSFFGGDSGMWSWELVRVGLWRMGRRWLVDYPFLSFFLSFFFFFSFFPSFFLSFFEPAKTPEWLATLCYSSFDTWLIWRYIEKYDNLVIFFTLNLSKPPKKRNTASLSSLLTQW